MHVNKGCPQLSSLLAGDCGNSPDGFGGWEAPAPSGLVAAYAGLSSRSSSNSGVEANDVWQLFDLATDPEERRDLLAGPGVATAHVEAAASMRAALEAHGRATQPALSWVTQGDPRASPSRHDGRWVSWLDEL